MKKTHFDSYLDEQLKDPDFAKRFIDAGAAWDVAVQLSELRQKSGLSQKQLAQKLHTSQQQVSRLESPAYEGHSLSMLRRVASALGAEVQVTFKRSHALSVAEPKPVYGKTRKTISARLSSRPRVVARGKLQSGAMSPSKHTAHGS